MKTNSKLIVTLLSAGMLTGILSSCGHEHTFADVWSFDATEHWHAATCEHKEERKDVGAHVDANNDFKCDVCDYKLPTPAAEYTVKVYEKTGIKASADVEKAKKGDVVTITISEIADGFQLLAVKMNGEALTVDASNPMVYKFVMPNQSAVVTFDLTVTGDVILEGDFSVALERNEETGVYEAKNVLVVNDPNKEARFDVKIGETKLQALDLDETRSFGDITMARTSGFVVRTHYYYDFTLDFTYDAPFAVQRVGVDDAGLPTSVDALSSLLITTYAVRSEVAMYSGLSSMNIKIDNTDGSENTDYIHQDYEWKLYSNNTSFGVVTDRGSGMDDPFEKYTYKSIDETNKTLTVVDTFDRKNGNLVANDDPFRGSYNKFGAYSAKYDIIDGDDYGKTHFSINETHARRTLATTAHMPSYYLERDIMDSYRVGYEGSDAMNWNERIISSQRNTGDQGFKVSVDSKVEYKFVNSGGSDASQAWVFDVDFKFDPRGAMIEISYKKYIYTADKWDFVNHKAAEGKQPSLVKRITGTFGYETPTTAFTSDIFDITPYFVNSISKVRFYNPITGKEDDGTTSYVQLSDDLYLYDDDFELSSKAEFEYAPKTALDIWQYGPTASSNEEVICKEPNDSYYAMSACNEGDAVVTISNHHTGAAAGATFDVPVNVSTKTLIRSYYLFDETDPYVSITDSTPVNVRVGSVHTFKVQVSPISAPTKYHAVSSNDTYAHITTPDNSKTMTIDFSGAVGITKNTKVTITMESDKYDPAFHATATVFTFYILPADIDPAGTWALYLKSGEVDTNTTIEFTDQVIEGTTTKLGKIHDIMGASKSLEAEFAYSFDGLVLHASLTKIKIIDSESWSTDPKDYELVFEYQAETQLYGVGLAERVYDADYEGFITSSIFGEVNDDGEFISLDAFKRIA